MEKCIKNGNKVLIIHTNEETKTECENLTKEVEKLIGSEGQVSCQSIESLQKGDEKSADFDTVISGYTKPFVHDSSFLRECHRVLKPGGILTFRELIPEAMNNKTNSNLVFECSAKLKISGFTPEKPKPGFDVDKSMDFVAYKQSFELNSQVKLKLPQANAWKITDTAEDDLINEDNLVEDDDVLDKETYHEVCEPTNTTKRKACKNCSCGLAEKIESENSVEEETPKSSCGSCYLGDAFRCSSCPYAGLPAFKPGEKVVIPSMD